MSGGEDFFDTNVVLYLLSADTTKADRAEELLAIGGTISVQVLNEFVAVASRKLNMSWTEIREVLAQVRAVCAVESVTIETPERALRIAERTTGFIYYVSVAGITGERAELPPEIIDNVGWLREQTDLPICIGFGISLPEHIRMLAPVADGLIVGSAIVRRVAEDDADAQAGLGW